MYIYNRRSTRPRTVCIFVLRLSALPFSGLVGKADYPPIRLHPPYGTAGICPLDCCLFTKVYSNTLDIFFCWLLVHIQFGQSLEGSTAFLRVLWLLNVSEIFGGGSKVVGKCYYFSCVSWLVCPV